MAASIPVHSDNRRWIDLGRVEEIPRLGSRQLLTPAMTIVLFRTADDRLYAIEDRCPRHGGTLSRGMVHGRSVTCPVQHCVIDLESGQLHGAAESRVCTLEVRLVDGRAQLALPERAVQAA